MTADEFEYISKGPMQGPPKKIIILIHGYAVNAYFMEKMADELLSELPDALIILPQAPEILVLPAEEDEDKMALSLPDEAKTPPVHMNPEEQRQWFGISESTGEMHDDMVRIAGQMNKFIDGLAEEIGIDEKDIAIMGFSQGGAIAFYTACMRHGRLACVVGHSTLVFDTSDFITQVPALLLYGSADQSFSLADYKSFSVMPLTQFFDDLQIEVIDGLSHRTSTESRKIVRDYIVGKMT